MAISVGALVVWPLGFWRRLAINYCFGRTQVGVVTSAGSVGVVKYVYDRDVPGWTGGVFRLDAEEGGSLLDFGHYHVRQPGLHFDGAWCPLWAVILVGGVCPRGGW